MKITALVKMNGKPVPVFDMIPPFKYKQVDGLIYGTNELLYVCYYHNKPSKTFQAFGGQKFKINLHNGKTIKCNGQWWDGGYGLLSKRLGIVLTQTAASTTEKLKCCYVFSGVHADRNRLYGLIQQYDGPIYPYWEYEKILKYDDMRLRAFNERTVLERAKKNLIKKAKAQASQKKNAERIVTDIWATLYGQGLEVNWHLNGATEPLDTFFEENNWVLDPSKKEA